MAGADSLATFRFFTNGIETNTKGFDVVATYVLDTNAGNTNFNLAYNNTQQTVEDFEPGIIDDVRIQELEEALPENRWTLGATHLMTNWRFMARYSWYDEWYDSEDTLTYDGYGMLDAEAGYTFNDRFTIVVGADNITDEVPDENPNAAAGVGNQYSQWAPGGFNGRFLYTRISYGF